MLSLILISTSPATPGERGLPAATERFNDFLASTDADWSDRASVIDYLVAYGRMLARGVRPFEEAAWRELVRRDVERALNIAASKNHSLIAEGDVPSRRQDRSGARCVPGLELEIPSQGATRRTGRRCGQRSPTQIGILGSCIGRGSNSPAQTAQAAEPVVQPLRALAGIQSLRVGQFVNGAR